MRSCLIAEPTTSFRSVLGPDLSSPPTLPTSYQRTQFRTRLGPALLTVAQFVHSASVSTIRVSAPSLNLPNCVAVVTTATDIFELLWFVPWFGVPGLLAGRNWTRDILTKGIGSGGNSCLECTLPGIFCGFSSLNEAIRVIGSGGV
jgi:hypothetical protein